VVAIALASGSSRSPVGYGRRGDPCTETQTVETGDVRPRFAFRLIPDDTRELVTEVAPRPSPDDRCERLPVKILAVNAEHVEADAEVAEPRLETRARGAMGGVVKLDHLAEESEAPARQAACGEELDCGVGTVSLERAARVEARSEAEIVQETGEVKDLAIVRPAVMAADRVAEQKAAPAVIKEKGRADLGAPFRCFATEVRLGWREFGETQAHGPPKSESASERATAPRDLHANEMKREQRGPGRRHVDGRGAIG